jgi:hypothetical protein
MEKFACQAIEKIADLQLPARIVTTTVHGTGYGLDGGEALQRLVRGFQQGLLQHTSATIERITFLTLGERAVRMLTSALDAVQRIEGSTADTRAPDRQSRKPSQPRGPASKQSLRETSSGLPPVSPDTQAVIKRRVFVAMPFSEEFQNVYEFGIYPAVRSCGLVCERIDETHFTGDILDRIRGRIESADLVVADLTEGKPNVYLEVGFAWGRSVPVIFVARKGEKLHFDVSTHKCIFYGRFTQFAKDLEQLIRGIGVIGEK